MWFTFWGIKWRVRSHIRACKIFREYFIPIMVGMGIMSPLGGLDDIREIEAREERWKSWGRDKLFLGADSDHPDGIYARGGADMICMTNDEYRHWFNG
jgi:hypothetical protein